MSGRGIARARAVLARLVNAPGVLWALLALPGLLTTYGYWRGTVFYGEFLHSSGELATRLLMLAMAVTPLRIMFPHARWVRWLLRRRRYIGVAAFGYSLLHAAVYVERQAPLGAILEDAMAAAMWTGWLALLVLVPLAVTSNDLAVRLLRRRWKWLHRGVYAAAVFTFAHWILSAFDPVPGIVHLGVLTALEGYRVWHVYANRRAAVRATPSSGP